MYSQNKITNNQYLESLWNLNMQTLFIYLIEYINGVFVYMYKINLGNQKKRINIYNSKDTKIMF